MTWSVRSIGGSMGLVAALSLGVGAEAATVSMTTGDAIGESSFTDAGHWDSGAAPTAGNDYVSSFLIRTPNAATGNYTFGGDSLTLETGGILAFKGAGWGGHYTIADLVLDGGTLAHYSGQWDGYWFEGAINITSASTVNAQNGHVVIQSTLSGTGDLTVTSGNSWIEMTFEAPTADNTWTGNLIIDNVVNFILYTNSNMTFDIGAAGVTNNITGTGSGTAYFRGEFVFDLTDAGTSMGDAWTIVDVGTLSSVGYDATFSVAGFTETSDGIWSDGTYEFSEATGILSVAAVPEPASLALMGLGGVLVAARRRR